MDPKSNTPQDTQSKPLNTRVNSKNKTRHMETLNATHTRSKLSKDKTNICSPNTTLT